MIVAPTVSYKATAQHSIGASLLLGYQRFKASGLQAFDNAPGFPPATSAHGRVTSNGYDSATGLGLRLGWQGLLGQDLSVGAAYTSMINMSRFDKYCGLFAGQGGFDIPANDCLGIAWMQGARTVAFDWVRIGYSKVPAVGNSSSAPAPLGADNGSGFGWRDVNVTKLGGDSAAYRPTACPRCQRSGLWRHGYCERKADRRVGVSADESLNAVAVPRFLCPACVRTCSRLQACIAPRRWFDWAV